MGGGPFGSVHVCAAFADCVNGRIPEHERLAIKKKMTKATAKGVQT